MFFVGVCKVSQEDLQSFPYRPMYTYRSGRAFGENIHHKNHAAYHQRSSFLYILQGWGPGASSSRLYPRPEGLRV